MKRSIIIFGLIYFTLLFLSACKDSQSTQSIVPQTSRAVYVCNSGASSISVIDLISGSVTNDVVTVGTWPNQLVYHDNFLYCVNSGSNNIMIFNTENWETTKPIELGLGQNPMNMVIYDDQLLYVACLQSNSVLQVNRTSKTVNKTIKAGVATTGITRAEGKIYATNTNAVFNGTMVVYGPGSVTVIDGDSGDSLTTIPVAMNPQSIGKAPDGTLHVICTGNYIDSFGKVLIIDPVNDLVLDSVNTGGTPGGLDVSSPDGIGYLSSWGLGLLSYSTENYSIINGTDDYLLGKGGSGLVSDEDGNVFVSVWEENQVIKIDKQGKTLSTFNVGVNPQALTIRND